VSEGVEERCVYLRCILCGRPLTSAVWKEHHISYCYEETVPVCRMCHARIHLSDLVEGFKLYGVFKPIDKKDVCKKSNEAKRRRRELSVVWSAVQRRMRELGVRFTEKRSLSTEGELYVYMLGVLDTMGEFLEKAIWYKRLPGVKETLKTFKTYLQRALEIVDLALETSKEPPVKTSEDKALGEYRKLIEEIEKIATVKTR
jgi:hypothetical protein